MWRAAFSRKERGDCTLGGRTLVGWWRTGDNERLLCVCVCVCMCLACMRGFSLLLEGLDCSFLCLIGRVKDTKTFMSLLCRYCLSPKCQS